MACHTTHTPSTTRVHVRQVYKGGELPVDSEDDIVADEYEEVTMHETQP
jgi:hypothetical protein